MKMNTLMSNIESVNQLIENMQYHRAWHDQINGDEAEGILKFHSPYTYILRRGEHDLHYFLSYVSQESIVLHKSIRINSDLVGYYPNGGGGCDRTKIYHKVEPLISECIGCHQNDLLPLSEQVSQAQGF